MKNQLQVSLFPYETNSQIESKVSNKINSQKLTYPSFLPSFQAISKSNNNFRNSPRFPNSSKMKRSPKKNFKSSFSNLSNVAEKEKSSFKKAERFSLPLSKNERTQENRVRVLDLRGGVLKSCPGDSRPSSPRGHPGHQILPVFHPSPRLTPSHPPRFVTLATSRWRTRVPPTLESSSSNFPGGSTGKSSTIHASHGRLTFL